MFKNFKDVVSSPVFVAKCIFITCFLLGFILGVLVCFCFI